MAYEFAIGEPIPAAVERLMLEQIERIGEQLGDVDHSIEKRVHDARKRMKETRALLRLIREPLGEAFTVENTWFRDAGRDLATARDAAAVVEAIEKLQAHTKDAALKRRLGRAKRKLQQRSADSELAARIDNVLVQLADARTRIGAWPPLENRFATIGNGLERTYRDGRRAFARVKIEPTPENFHELRKRVKDHWYHMRLLRLIWPDVLEGYAKTLEELSDALGDHHDLIVVARALDDDPQLRPLFDDRRAELEETAIELAKKVYAERPRDVRRRIRAYWRA